MTILPADSPRARRAAAIWSRVIGFFLLWISAFDLTAKRMHFENTANAEMSGQFDLSKVPSRSGLSQGRFLSGFAIEVLKAQSRCK